MTSMPDLVEPLVLALGRLAALGEEIQDEWTYVRDLDLVWSARLRAVAVAHETAGTRPAVPADALEAAVARLIAEADAITDPHRAIDWLSTLPQVALVALGEAAW